MAGVMRRDDVAKITLDAMEREGIGVCICGLDGRVQYANSVFLAHFGVDEKPGAPDRTINELSPALGDILSASFRDRGVQRRDITVTTPTGFVRSLGILLTIMEQSSGDGSVAVIVTHDISRYSKERSEEQWHDIVDGLEDGFYECDIQGRFIHANRAMCLITEYDYHEFIGLSYKKLYTPDDQKRIYDIYHEVYVTGKPNRFVNFIAITKHGRKKFVECSISPVRGADGSIRAFRGIIRDVSEKNRMEKELQRARKLEAIGILSGGIAHDYNNALTAILGNISLAKMEADPENTSLMEVLNDAEEASLRTVDLTRRLSIFARGGKPERKVINYEDPLRVIVDAALIDYAGTYTLTIQEGLWDTDIDEFQIGQVISYIIDNAVESMAKPGTITINAENIVAEHEMSHHEITLQPGRYVRISVSDEGCGIPPENFNSIFDPYFTTKEMASGMGLATSYAIIKRHHGYIDVKSTIGKGSVFSVYLPVPQEQHQG